MAAAFGILLGLIGMKLDESIGRSTAATGNLGRAGSESLANCGLQDFTQVKASVGNKPDHVLLGLAAHRK